MKFDYPYATSREDARIRLQALGEYLHNRHGIDVRWVSDDQAKFSGKYLMVKIDGEMTVSDGVVQVRGQDPGMLWRKKAQGYLQGKLASYLNPSTPVDSLPRGK